MLYKNTLYLYNTFELYIFKTIYRFKLSINKNFGNMHTVLITQNLKKTYYR